MFHFVTRLDLLPARRRQLNEGLHLWSKASFAQYTILVQHANAHVVHGGGPVVQLHPEAARSVAGDHLDLYADLVVADLRVHLT